MPLFACKECLCMDNTVGDCSQYWEQEDAGVPDLERLCSECDPAIGKWHGKFQKVSAIGRFIGTDGFCYDKQHPLRISIKLKYVVTPKGFELIKI